MRVIVQALQKSSLSFIVLLYFCVPASAASFDCDKAKSTSEHLICSDSELSEMDDDFGSLYKKAKNLSVDKPEFNRTGRIEWQKRQATCADKPCLLDWYAKRRLYLFEIIEKAEYASGGGRTDSERSLVSEQNRASNSQQGLQDHTENPSTIKAIDMYSEYSNDPDAASIKYNSHKLLISGVVISSQFSNLGVAKMRNVLLAGTKKNKIPEEIVMCFNTSCRDAREVTISDSSFKAIAIGSTIMATCTVEPAITNGLLIVQASNCTLQ